MPLNPVVILLILAAAGMHATWNALVKSSAERLVTQMMVIGVGAVVGLAFVPWLPLPDRASWPFIVLSVAAHNGYHLFLLLAYRHGDLSHVYPLARGVAPLTVAVLADALAGETLGVRGTVGVVLVSSGIASLAWGRETHWRPVVYALVTGLFISVYSVIDGMGVRRAGNELAYIAWLFLCGAAPIVIATFLLRGRRAAEGVALVWRRGMIGGLIATLGYAIVVWAMSTAAMARVVALRESSVIIAAIIGVLFLGERSGRRRILAAVLVAAGNVLLNLRAA